MKFSFLFLSCAIFLLSCNESKQSSTTPEVKDTVIAVENKVMIPASTCYTSQTGKDSFTLKVETFPNVVTGKLMYKYYEKDSNSGELDGKFYGDTLLADYKFRSEGIQSTRQVIFLIKDGVAIEGYGDVEDKNGKMVFKDLKQVSFGKGLMLKKVECGEF